MKTAGFFTIIVILSVSLLTLPCAAFEGEMGLENADISYLGANNYGYTGWAVSAGDVDGDGMTDFLFGGSEVYLILGKHVGRTSGATVEDLADASFIAENSGDDFGDAVCMTGDVNNDGFDDILIGADRYNAGQGKTYLVLGRADGWELNTPILDAAAATFTGENTGDWSGFSIAVAGDTNQDGYDDIFIGAYLADVDGNTSAGRVYLFLGKADGWTADTGLGDADAIFQGSASETGVGRILAPAGDVNGDGYPDILIGRRDTAYLFLGRAAGWSGTVSLSSADASIEGDNVYKLAPAGDVNGDGFGDILIGADEDGTHGSRTGMTYIMFGKAAGWAMATPVTDAGASFYGSETNDHLGAAVAPAGDVNNDGFDDILIGATWAERYAGKAYLVYGKETGWQTDADISTADASFPGEASYDYAGFAMAPAGDANGDGNDDILISAAYFGAAYTGNVYFFYSDDPVYGDLDEDRDVDGSDLAAFALDPGQLDLEKFSGQLGYNNG